MDKRQPANIFVRSLDQIGIRSKPVADVFRPKRSFLLGWDCLQDLIGMNPPGPPELEKLESPGRNWSRAECNVVFWVCK